MANDGRPDLGIEIHGTYVEAHLLGKFSASCFKEQAAAVATVCRDRKMKLVLLNATALEGRLSTMDRFEMGSQGAIFGKGLKVAGVLREEMVDPGKFGVIVARNRGLATEVFSDRDKALAWLLER